MARSGTLTLLQINDTHGYLEAHPELFWEGNRAVYKMRGGYARIHTLFQQIRDEKKGAVLAFDNGDTLHGTYPAVFSQGEAMIAPLNHLGLDAWTVHWDCAYGPKRLYELSQRLQYPLLASNCYAQDNRQLIYPPYTVIERAGLRIGVIGIAAVIIDTMMPAHFSEGLLFTLGNAELPGHIETLRQKEDVDLVVVLSHLGFPQDVKLASEVSGIDVLLSGHTHNRLDTPVVVNGTTIIQSGCHGSFVGQLDITLTDGKISDVAHRLIEVDDSLSPDRDMQQLVDTALEPHRALLAETVGHTETALNRNTVLEATMDNLILQAIAHAAGTVLAFSNGWRYGAPIPPGEITVNDLWNMVPSNPPVSVAELTGAEIWEMLEENLEHTFSKDPYAQKGGYVKRCGGLTLYFKFENPYGMRLQQVFVEGEPLDRGHTYTAAYITTQGIPANYGRNRYDLEIRTIDALKGYLKQHPRVAAELRGTAVAV